jgi:potassium-dependent mechanosensitive channel
MEKRFRKGEIIIRQGDIKDKYMYYIVQGKATIQRAANGIVIDCGFLHKGDIFGEMSLIIGTERAATVLACEDETIVLQLDRKSYHEAIVKSPELAWKILSKLAIRTQMLNEIQDQITSPRMLRQIFSGSDWV